MRAPGYAVRDLRTTMPIIIHANRDCMVAVEEGKEHEHPTFRKWWAWSAPLREAVARTGIRATRGELCRMFFEAWGEYERFYDN